VYIEVPKVACSSIKIALASIVGVDLDAVGGNPHEAPFPEPVQRANGPKLFPGLFAFAFVRNPWDRLASCYRDKVAGEAAEFTGIDPRSGVAYCLSRFGVFRPDMSFEEFVHEVAAIPDAEADDHFRSQHTFVSNNSAKIAIDFVGRFENLSTDFKRACQQLGIGELKLPRVQAMRLARPYSQFYTNDTRRVVAQRFAADVELFGYRFD
jgi:hypothetical protein